MRFGESEKCVCGPYLPLYLRFTKNNSVLLLWSPSLGPVTYALLLRCCLHFLANTCDMCNDNKVESDLNLNLIFDTSSYTKHATQVNNSA